MLIQKQIQLQKIELNYREREIKLRERELVEREKNLNEKSNDTILIHNEEKFEQKTTDQDMKDVCYLILYDNEEKSTGPYKNLFWSLFIFQNKSN